MYDVLSAHLPLANLSMGAPVALEAPSAAIAEATAADGPGAVEQLVEPVEEAQLAAELASEVGADKIAEEPQKTEALQDSLQVPEAAAQAGANATKDFQGTEDSDSQSIT